MFWLLRTVLNFLWVYLYFSIYTCIHTAFQSSDVSSSRKCFLSYSRDGRKFWRFASKKILFLRKKWEFFQKSPLFPAIFPIFAKIAYFPSGGTVWKRRPPKKRRLKWCGWTEYMFIYIISSAAKLVEWKPSSLQVQKYLGSTDTKQMHVEHKNRTKT